MGRTGCRNRTEYERALSEKLVGEGYEVFSPWSACDRVALKDGKVFFVEFKKPQQELSPIQQRVHDALPDNYLVLYSG